MTGDSTQVIVIKAKGSDQEAKAILISEKHEPLWLLLHRYATMFGPHSGEGRGWQLATPPGAMDAFGADFGVNVECFASPFNRR